MLSKIHSDRFLEISWKPTCVLRVIGELRFLVMEGEDIEFVQGSRRRGVQH